VIAVLAGLLLGAPLQQVTTRSTLNLELPDSARPFAEAEPDVLLRGRTATVVVRGRDLAALKTLTIGSPAGITIRSIIPLASSGKGVAAVRVELTVAADAEPGEHALRLTIAPEIQSSAGLRPGGDSLKGTVGEAIGKVMQQGAEPEEYGWIYVNSHDLLVTDVKRGRGDEVLITASDPEGDLETPTLAATTGDLVLVTGSDLVTSEARCGGDVIDSVLDDARVKEARAGRVLLAATLAREALPEGTACTVRVRVRDKAKNTSPWFTMKGIVP
jgi:hypothetical protein